MQNNYTMDYLCTVVTSMFLISLSFNYSRLILISYMGLLPFDRLIQLDVAHYTYILITIIIIIIIIITIIALTFTSAWVAVVCVACEVHEVISRTEGTQPEPGMTPFYDDKPYYYSNNNKAYDKSQVGGNGYDESCSLRDRQLWQRKGCGGGGNSDDRERVDSKAGSGKSEKS